VGAAWLGRLCGQSSERLWVSLASPSDGTPSRSSPLPATAYPLKSCNPP
jgi:hypothetical protein